MRVHWLQHVPFEALGSIEGWLAERGASVTVTRLWDGEALPDLDGLDLVIAMGGPMSVNDEDRFPWLTGELRFIREASSVFHWHGETYDLPKGSVSLARSPGCEHQAYRIGRRVVGIQFHLETTPALVQAMVTHCADDLAPGTFVQSEAELRGADASAYARINGLMEQTLGYLCQPRTEAVSERR